MYFQLKYDLKIICVVIAVIMVLAVPAILYFPDVYSMLFIAFIIIFGVSLIFFGYKVTDNALIIKCGVFSWKIYLKDIKTIELLPNPYSVKLKYKKSSAVFLSLKCRNDFVNYLSSKCTDAELISKK